MDPITHTMAGAAIAAAGWRRRTALAAPVAMLAANAPDIDIVAYVHGEYAALALRRGWTHGPLALVILAVLVPLLALAYDRTVRLRRSPDAAPARAGPLLAVSAIAALSHPLLDWMNTYGVRWLMPFDSSWHYGDSLFIIDPWAWLALAVPLFLLHSSRPAALVGWALGAALASALVLNAAEVPAAARILWLAVLAAAVLMRVRRPAAAWQARAAPVARAGLGVLTLYIASMVALDRAAGRQVDAYARASGIPAARIMVSPRPANPLRGDVVIATGDAYHFGVFDWRATPRLAIEPDPVPAGSLDHHAARAAAATRDAHNYLQWSRFPIITVQPTATGHTVHFGDARYPQARRMGALGGLQVTVPTPAP